LAFWAQSAWKGGRGLFVSPRKTERKYFSSRRLRRRDEKYYCFLAGCGQFAIKQRRIIRKAKLQGEG
jgi:hypothetical protein